MKFTTRFALSALGCLLLVNAHADSAYQWGPWMAQEDIERAILAGADPTELTAPTAAGPASPALPQLAAITDVTLPRPNVPNAPTIVVGPTLADGPVYGTVSWSGSANVLLTMTAPGGGDVSVFKTTLPLSGGATATLADTKNIEGVRSTQISVTGPTLPSGEYKFSAENQFDRPRSPATPTTLKLTGDDNRTSATYNDSLKVGQTASHSVTLDGSGVPTYSK